MPVLRGEALMADTETGTTHHSEGTWHETVIECPETGEKYGPGAEEATCPNWCPYCGEDAKDAAHSVSEDYGEISCDYTTMSTWRYCPGCGKQAGEIQ